MSADTEIEPGDPTSLSDADPEAWKKPLRPTPTIHHERAYRAALRVATAAEALRVYDLPRQGPDYEARVKEVNSLRGEFVADFDAAVEARVEQRLKRIQEQKGKA
jgi:uncharacterized protein YciW